MPNVIIVSNRLPVSVKKTNGVLEFYPSVGGLATALSHYTTDQSSKWIGWPGIASDDITETERRTISKKLAVYNCYPVFLSKKQLDLYYNGFSNSILWPLFHNLPVKLDKYEAYWKSYRDMNSLFTDAVLSMSTKQSNVWVQDYQLLLVPALLRLERPHNNIGFFLHIPFPDATLLAVLPNAKQLLIGMLGADLVGFHTESYTNNFLDACNKLEVGIANGKNLILQNRVVRIADFPISIDYAKSIQLSSSPAVEREARVHRKKYGRMKVILTVDRLDPTKGLVQRLKAYQTLLEENVQLYGKVIMVMLATPTRTEIVEYRVLKKQVETLVTEINERFGVAGWLPIDYKYETLPYERVVALYKIADVAFITPLRDGMNLVAKEYVASKQNKKGVLILSETAGAAEEMKSAIIVNPNRPAAMVNALNKALNMPQIELKKRLTTMQKQLSVNNVQKWAGSFMDTLQRSHQIQVYRTRGLSSPIKQLLLDNYHQATDRKIFMDYDGTLSPFFDDPSDSKPSHALYKLLGDISAVKGNDVIIISGRSRSDLDEWLGNLPITLVAEHGSYVKKQGQKWVKKHHAALGWKKSIRKIMEVYSARTPGSFVEEKDNALVWHYRKSPAYQAQKNMVILKRLLTTSLRGSDLKVHSGNKILEVKPLAANKGVAVSELMGSGSDFVLSVGDDYTDEDMFTHLPAHAFTIKVGPGRTNARYRLEGVNDVLRLLKKLV